MSHLLATSSAPKLCHNCGCPHGRTIRRSFSHYDGRLWQQKPPTGIAYGVLTAINTADNSMLCDLQQLQRRLRRRLLVRSARINCAMKYDNCNRLRCVALCCVVTSACRTLVGSRVVRAFYKAIFINQKIPVDLLLHISVVVVVVGPLTFSLRMFHCFVPLFPVRSNSVRLCCSDYCLLLFSHVTLAYSCYLFEKSTLLSFRFIRIVSKYELSSVNVCQGDSRDVHF